ncbi:class I lanthipeptide [uncultured Dokdonia sp.]|uniref:class I lanthipeptide n=1 Tax=uncultured Dokdonia sp. TaxID=575653 RepID=UPI00261633AB|nr:class I lanthipeptide [uncultured Dokdonia sp.]
MKKTKFTTLSISKTTIASLNVKNLENIIGGNHPTSSVCDQPDTYTIISNQTGPSMSDVLETILNC